MRETEDPGERHASWLELFFDLVAVAGVAQLAHLLHGEPDGRDYRLYVVLFLAFWIAWMCFTMYGNVAGDKARTRTLLVGMFGLAVMAAAVHGIQEGEREEAFAVAYVFVRFVASRAWEIRRELVIDWPVAQFSVGVIPWVVSIWVDDPARYWLWAAGVALDLWITFTFSAHRLMDEMQKRIEHQRERRGAQRRGGVADVTAAYADPAHLGERLGLFVIIVLGEGVAQLIAAASGAEWNRELYGFALGAFVLLVLLWSVSLRHGYGGVPHLAPGVLPARIVLALHCFTTGALAAVAAGLGAAAEHLDTGLPDESRLLLCASLAIYILIGCIAGTISMWAYRARLLLTVLPPLALTLLLGLPGADVSALVLVWLLALSAAWFGGRFRPPDAAAAA